MRVTYLSQLNFLYLVIPIIRDIFSHWGLIPVSLTPNLLALEVEALFNIVSSLRTCVALSALS
jgi:hypothetical protein